MDILQKAIVDANKMKEVAMKAAEKSLHQKFAKELKHLYLEQVSSDMNDPDLDESMLEEYNFNMEDQDPSQTPDIEGGMPGQEDAQAGGMPGAPEGAPEAGGAPLDSNAPGTEPGEGMAPQNASTPLTGDTGIPFIHEIEDFGTGEKMIQIVFGDESEGGPFGSADFDAQADQTQGDTSEFLTQQNTVDTGNPDLGPEAPEEFADEPLDQNAQRNPFSLNKESKQFDINDDSIEVSDEILLEYIDKALTNDQKVKDLADTVASLQEMMTKITNQLEDSNKKLGSLKEQNIRLIYQNKTLNDISLSENQKQSIVKALDKAKTLDEAKLIYESTKITSAHTKNTVSNINAILTPSAGKKMTEESASMLKESREPSQNQPMRQSNVLRENKENVNMPPILEKLYKSWGIK